jgi:hypothetical protein
MDFVSRLEFENNYKTQSFGNWDCFNVQVRGETPGVSLLSPEVIEVSSF